MVAVALKAALPDYEGGAEFQWELLGSSFALLGIRGTLVPGVSR